MARPPRVDAPGAIHHVMLRGVEGRSIFSASTDYEDFVSQFGALVREHAFRVHAWCLLLNHVHLVLQTTTTPLASLMARLNSRHAQRFNRTTGRVGHLFQDRYKAVLVERDDQLVSTIAYVLGNAARHGLISSDQAPGYPWSMYGALVGRRRPREFEDVAGVARALGSTRREISQRVLHESLEPGASGARLEPDQIDELTRLVRACCERHRIAPGLLGSSTRQGRAARQDLFAHAARSIDLPLTEIARVLRVSARTIARAKRRFEGG